MALKGKEASPATAEMIAERPQVSGSYPALSKFGRLVLDSNKAAQEGRHWPAGLRDQNVKTPAGGRGPDRHAAPGGAWRLARNRLGRGGRPTCPGLADPPSTVPSLHRANVGLAAEGQKRSGLDQNQEEQEGGEGHPNRRHRRKQAVVGV